MSDVLRIVKPIKRHRRRREAIVVCLCVLVGAFGLNVYWKAAKHAGITGRLSGAIAQHQFDEARLLLATWDAMGQKDGEPEYFRAKLEVVADRPIEALAAMQIALDKGFPSEPVFVLRAVLQARAGRIEGAEPILRKALAATDGPEPEVAEALTRIYLGAFRLNDASKTIERWMKDAPDDARPYLWRNQIDERIGSEPDAIIRNYRDALARDPNLDKARLGLADVLRKSFRTDEAAVEYAAFLERNPQSVAGNVGAGQIALIKGDLQAASRRFDAALSVDPNEPVALRELALIDLRNGRYDLARDRLEKVVRIDPFDPEIRYTFAQALKMTGDLKRSAEELAATERLRNDNRRLTELRETLIKRPEDAAFRLETAAWLIDHGHEKEGLDWCALILKKQPGHQKTCRYLADYHAKKGNAGLANYYRLAATPEPSTK